MATNCSKAILTFFLCFNGQYSFCQDQTVNQNLLPIYGKEIKKALSYFPELDSVNILLRIRKAHAPLSTRPSFLSIFKKPSKRTYIITISDSTEAIMSPILFKQLSDSAKIGVLGHELSHVAQFQSCTFLGFLRLGIKNLSKRKVDMFEYNTDLRCMQHQMGHYLLAWSCFVRQALHQKNWRGADNLSKKDLQVERYMNPETITHLLSHY